LVHHDGRLVHDLFHMGVLLTRLAFWYLPNLRFGWCSGRFGPKLDPNPW
jgi:hypothetical protein